MQIRLGDLAQKMQAAELKEKLSKIKMWQRGGECAPHKPPLLLCALGRLTQGEPRLMSYSQTKDDLKNLLVEFGPYRHNHSPSYPFVRLTNESIYQIGWMRNNNKKKIRLSMS